ncbi:MAG: hypothetical protein JKY42_02430 [Flavobacteriales bacterium]|nr:hypothetical protein [Flavobacteriales bacterium]
MKKVLTFAAVIALTASFTSCKKTYDCTYEDSFGNKTETECVKCSKDDVADLEDAGWECS